MKRMTCIHKIGIWIVSFKYGLTHFSLIRQLRSTWYSSFDLVSNGQYSLFVMCGPIDEPDESLGPQYAIYCFVRDENRKIGVPDVPLTLTFMRRGWPIHRHLTTNGDGSAFFETIPDDIDRSSFKVVCKAPLGGEVISHFIAKAI